MKRGITIEFDMHEECYHIQKQRGEDQFFIYMNTENSYYDEGGGWVDVAPKGDYVKAYTYDTIRRIFEGVRK